MKDHLFLAEYGLPASVPPQNWRGAVSPAVHAEMMGVLHGHQGGLLLTVPLPRLGAAPPQDFGV